METNGWLLFLSTLRAGDSRQRVAVWRKLKKLGALPFKTSASLLPDTPQHFERLQWLAKEVRDEGGDATLIRVKAIEDLTREQIIDLFNRARAEDYDPIFKALRTLERTKRRKNGADFSSRLEKLREQLRELRTLDFFHSARGQEVEELLVKLANRGGDAMPVWAPLKRSAFRGKSWVTRPRPEIDRAASAWLIQRFIDPDAKFVFAQRPDQAPAAIPYDMAQGDFTHQGDDCTFETLVKRFQLQDRGLQKLAEMVHDADLEDAKFKKPGADALHRMLQGLARLGWTDEQILRHSFACFDGLHAELKAE